MTTSQPTTTPLVELDYNCKLHSKSILDTFSNNPKNEIYDSDEFVFLSSKEFIKHKESTSYFCRGFPNTHYTANCFNGTLKMAQNCAELLTGKNL